MSTKDRVPELVEKRARLAQELAETNHELAVELGFATASAPATVTHTPTKRATATPKPSKNGKKVGRPKGSKNKPKEAETTTVTTESEAASAEKKNNLPSLIIGIGEQAKKPLTQAEIVTLIRAAGYTTKAKDFSNMVYQSLLKLCGKGVFKKVVEVVEGETKRSYEYVGQAA